MLKTDFFWTDSVQAQERLAGSYIKFGDKVAYVEEVRNPRAGPTATIIVYPEGLTESIPLSDPRFGRFRTPLPIGWVNSQANKRAFYVSRAPQRSRIHGMTRSNVALYTVDKLARIGGAGDYASYDNLAKDPQYSAAIRKEYPPLSVVLDKLKNGTCIAVSNTLCLFRDSDGIRWLFVGTDRVGLFTGADTLLLLSSFSYVKEQLQEAPEFTVNNLVEF